MFHKFFLESSMDSKRRQYEYQSINQSPYKRYPGRHLEVSGLIYSAQSIFALACLHAFYFHIHLHSQPAHNTAGNQPLKSSNNGICNRSYPYQLPVPPLHYACPKCNDQMDNAEEEQSPAGSKAPDIGRMVEVVWRRDAYRKRPV